MSLKKLKVFYFCLSLLFATQVFAETSSVEPVLNAQTGTMGIAFPAGISANGTGIRVIAEERSMQSTGAVSVGATPAETCMSTASVVKSFFGIVYAHTNMEINTRCANRLDAREMRTMFGESGVKAAKQIMCEGNPVVQMAWRKIGEPCIGYEHEEDPDAAKKKKEKEPQISLPEASASNKGHPARPTEWYEQ